MAPGIQLLGIDPQTGFCDLRTGRPAHRRTRQAHCTQPAGGRRPSVRVFLLLTDCMSPMAGFEAQHQAVLAALRAQGVQLSSSTEIRL